jgi:hypothetical protein
MATEECILLQWSGGGQREQRPPTPLADAAVTCSLEHPESSHYHQNDLQMFETPLYPEPLQFSDDFEWSYLEQQQLQPQSHPRAAFGSPEEGLNQSSQQRLYSLGAITPPPIVQFTTAKRGPGRPRVKPLPSHKTQPVYEATLEKNRIAAQRYRRRDAEATKRLKAQAEEFTTENEVLKKRVKLLREEMLSLKYALLEHASCGFQAIDEYIQRYVRDVAGTGPSVEANSKMIDKKEDDEE